MADVMFLFNLLYAQNIANQRNKSYFYMSKNEGRNQKQLLSHLISTYKNHFYER